VPDLLGILEIDRIDFEEGEVAFAFLRAPYLALDRVAGPEREPPDLRGRDVDVVGAGEIVGVRRSQEAEAVLEHLDHAFADDVGFLAGELFENGEHQLLLAERGRVLHLELFGKAEQLHRRFPLQVLKLHFRHA
jgi:hypothetical protein